MPNYNPETGIPYGYIAAHKLNSELVDELMFGSQAKDEGYEAALKEKLAEELRGLIAKREEEHEAGVYGDTPFSEEAVKEDFENDYKPVIEEAFNEEYQSDERQVSGELDGVKYASSWLGGALNFFIFQSPIIAKCRPCSLCVPGAGNLDQEGEGDYECYGVPEDWKDKDEG